MSPHLCFIPIDADMLLAPRLRTFCWTFDRPGSEPPNLMSFSCKEEEWIREFARAAIERGSTLKEIKIEYSPKPNNHVVVIEMLGYPWDRMVEIRNEIQPHGIALEFNEPVITRGDWQQLARSGEVWQASEDEWRHTDDRNYHGEAITRFFAPKAEE